jgi:hypothetical protein
MRLFVQCPIGPQTGLAEIDAIPDHSISEIKQQVCNSFQIDPGTVALMYGGTVLDDNATVGTAGIPENAQLALMPHNIVGGTLHGYNPTL